MAAIDTDRKSVLDLMNMAAKKFAPGIEDMLFRANPFMNYLRRNTLKRRRLRDLFDEARRNGYSSQYQYKNNQYKNRYNEPIGSWK